MVPSRISIRNIVRQLRAKLTSKYYIIGILPQDDININSEAPPGRNVNWIKFPNYKINWLADPFIIEHDSDSLTLFAEQWIDRLQKGIIVKLVISKKNYNICSLSSILELNSHLSFPIIYRENNILYVYPENYQGGNLKIYRYDYSTNKLVEPKVLVNAPLVDAQILKIDTTYYIFATKYTGNDDSYKRLYIYKSSSLFGPYSQFQIIENSSKTERSAGLIFKKHDVIVRPVQDCRYSYGSAVIFKELRFKDGQFEESEIGSLLPHATHCMGLHTYNCKDTIVSIDGISYRFGNWLRRVKQFFEK